MYKIAQTENHTRKFYQDYTRSTKHVSIISQRSVDLDKRGKDAKTKKGKVNASI